MTYYPNGAIAGFTYGNGIVHTLTQNARGLPDRSRDLDGSTPVHDDSYDYDAVGNVLAISDAVSGNRGHRDMTYDALNRLTLVTGADGAPSPMFGIASYDYDVLDNLTHVQVTGGSQSRNQDYCYDTSNRLTNVKTGGCGGTSVVGLGYDVQGNLNNRSGVLFGFDYGNRMRTGGPESYRYDVQGRRIRSSSSAGVIDSLYAQSGQLLFQRDGRSSKRRQYIYLGGSLVAESDMPLTGSTVTVTYQHTDALVSPVATTDSAKTVLQRSEYEPYGYLLNQPMEDGPGYTGHATDAATGLVYMQQRYYDPLCGCFVSTDPVTALSNPTGAFNRYRYAYNNPYRFTDPDGRCPIPGSDLCEKTIEIAKARAQAAENARQEAQHAIENVATDVKNRVTVTAEGGAAYGSGVAGQANKTIGSAPDSVGGHVVLGQGLYAGANVSVRLFSFGSQEGKGSSGKIAVSPDSYFKIKLGAGISLGASLVLNGSGGGTFSVSVGIGIGEETIVKPPATLGYEKDL